MFIPHLDKTTHKVQRFLNGLPEQSITDYDTTPVETYDSGLKNKTILFNIKLSLSGHSNFSRNSNWLYHNYTIQKMSMSEIS